ncbi:hypothetical protein NM688_g590 [Phlebia brevispora]|uniref:Uncharacterized protein n=1 Tax=Phlebia brevispora TaxID=194682 RepID=A0ACC1TDW7_9APHY|nr:hypothetical protein NM688_g590 [Phlebia brevispora]
MTPTPSTVLGPALVGVILNVLLHGVMGLQCCHYYNWSCHTYNDPKWMRILIGVLLLAETVSTIFDIVWIYDILIHHFSAFGFPRRSDGVLTTPVFTVDPTVLTAANWLFATDPAMVGIIATIVQMFFAWRIQIVTLNNWVTWFIRITALGSLFGGLGTAIAIHFVSDFLEFHRFKVIMIIWLVSAVVCDTTIAVSLSTYLLRRRTGIRQTDHLIAKVTTLTVGNGLLVTIVAIANLIAFLVTPSALYLAFNFPLAKLYSNSLMSTLNNRQTAKLASVTVSSSSMHPTPDRRQANLNRTRSLVFVKVETDQHADAGSETKRDVEWSGSGSSRTTPTPSEKGGSKAPPGYIEV